MLPLCLSILSTETEQKEFESLYRKYCNSILYYANGKLHNTHQAEDVAHDTWLYIAEHFEKFQKLDEISMKNYIFKMVQYQCVNLFRRQTTEYAFSEAIDMYLPEQNYSDEDYILFSICQKETAEAIVSCLEQLDACYRDVLNLYYLNENTTYEIAEILHLKDGTVRQRLARGRQKLKELLEKNGFEYKF